MILVITTNHKRVLDNENLTGDLASVKKEDVIVAGKNPVINDSQVVGLSLFPETVDQNCKIVHENKINFFSNVNYREEIPLENETEGNICLIQTHKRN
ncbi:hypothetical protein DGG96_14435 [Legionella qingyii]|uniref:Uncharacterized protein n=1 Tax=Legionella qingyii TaxID=2184757 RepID=A0A317U2F8_9GAMM|nr:hypothetical protein [Legionella qingyii]PWY54926.1 hypothetical protein DGG96_14435 [Legionella qingyii]